MGFTPSFAKDFFLNDAQSEPHLDKGFSAEPQDLFHWHYYRQPYGQDVYRRVNGTVMFHTTLWTDPVTDTQCFVPPPRPQTEHICVEVGHRKILFYQY